MRLGRPTSLAIRTHRITPSGSSQKPSADCGSRARRVSTTPSTGSSDVRYQDFEGERKPAAIDDPVVTKKPVNRLPVSLGEGLTTPSGTKWTVAKRTPLVSSTPTSNISTSPLPTPEIEIQATGDRKPVVNEDVAAPANHKEYVRYTAKSTPRLSSPRSVAAFREMQFQQFREDLWRRGLRQLSHLENADIFVVPLKLPRAALDERTTKAGDGVASSPVPRTPRHGHFTVRAVVHSKRRAAIGLMRRFDLDALRATLPDPLPSPRSPNFDREALLSALEMRRRDTPSVSPLPLSLPQLPDAGSPSGEAEVSPMSEGSSPSENKRPLDDIVVVPMRKYSHNTPPPYTCTPWL